MKTKLVYVLTCAPEATYIEQALISIWSARYHNPDAHIVLLVDDLTNQLLVGKRAEVLEYITEKVVIPFEDANATMMYRSRWIKTSVRQLVEGNFLFIDCDTIVVQSLAEIDSCIHDIAMVLDEHSPTYEYTEELKLYTQHFSLKLGYDALKENEYFNSGVMYAKDEEHVHKLWRLWHQYWIQGEKDGVGIDQPALGKANIACDHIIQQLPREWNTLIYMNPIFISAGKILHFWNFRNRSYIFCKSYLKYVREHGMNKYVQDCVLNPLRSLLPSDNILNKAGLLDFIKYRCIIRKEKQKYAKHVDPSFSDFPWKKGFCLLRKYVKIKMFKKGHLQEIYHT